MRNLAIIPARSGSKGLINKNIKLLNGKPLIAYSIEAAIESKQFSTVMVSTDSEEYAEIARLYGAEVPFLRSEHTSSDTASTWDTVREVLSNYQKMQRTYDTFCVLQPTSPLRNALDIGQAYNLFSEKDATAIISMCEMDHPLAWCGELDENYSLNGFMNCGNGKQRQNEKNCYRLNGALYILDVLSFLENPFLYREGAYAYIMSRERSIDIDTELDFRLAEFLMQNR
ncbi:MAG: acylneuraminate cytidylyltransferase family protein [Lachnospiraceae bacterium]|nr:acylneuraminate cytidylyltransferase family protein [Lachnospiraceae bacterium]